MGLDGQFSNRLAGLHRVARMATNSWRAIMLAPRLTRCRETSWQSRMPNSFASIILEIANSAIFDAFASTLNIDSPKKARPIASP